MTKLVAIVVITFMVVIIMVSLDVKLLVSSKGLHASAATSLGASAPVVGYQANPGNQTQSQEEGN